MSESYNTTSGNGYIVPKYSDGVDGPGAFKEFADGLDLEHIVPMNAKITANTGSIDTNTGNIKDISNRLDALENTSLSAEWTIASKSGGTPSTGELSLDSDVWASVKVLHLSLKDKNGVDHNFSNVNEGDTIQIGVGPDAKASGSSAAYTVTSVDEKDTGEFGVTHLASTGEPKIGFNAIVAVYPQFDPSNYVTQGELDAVKSDKFDRGTGDLDYADAVVLGKAVTTNTGDISDNAANITANKVDIDKIVAGIGGSVDNDGNITLPDPTDISGIVGLERVKFLGNFDDFSNVADPEIGDTFLRNADYIFYTWVGDKWVVNFHYSDWKTVQEIDTKVTNNTTNIENVIEIIGGEVTDGNINLPDPINIDSKFDVGTGTTDLNDATAMEAAIGENAVNIEELVVALGGNIDNISGIEIDALPPQAGADGKFLTTNGSEASWAEIDIPDALPDGGSEGKFLSVDADGDAIWAAPKTRDIGLSADSAFSVDFNNESFDTQEDVNTYIANHGLFKGTMITWGDIANKTDADA